jgi:hypothetical protein
LPKKSKTDNQNISDSYARALSALKAMDDEISRLIDRLRNEKTEKIGKKKIGITDINDSIIDKINKILENARDQEVALVLNPFIEEIARLQSRSRNRKNVTAWDALNSIQYVLLGSLEKLKKEKDKRDQLTQSVAENFNKTLLKEGISEEQAKKLSIIFANMVFQEKQNSETTIRLPDKPPEKWKKGQGETALEFLRRVYKPYLEARILTYQWLKDHDKPLYIAVLKAVSRDDKLDKTYLPLTESERSDIEYDECVEIYGKDVVKRIATISHTKDQRDRRNERSVSNAGMQKTASL